MATRSIKNMSSLTGYLFTTTFASATATIKLNTLITTLKPTESYTYDSSTSGSADGIILAFISTALMPRGTLYEYQGSTFLDVAVKSSTATYTTSLTSTQEVDGTTYVYYNRQYGINNGNLVTITPSNFPYEEVTTKTFIIADGTIENCSYTYTPTELTGGTEVTITVTANTGYEFTTAPTATYIDINDDADAYITKTITGTIATDKATATISVSSTITDTLANYESDADKTLTINASATTIVVIPNTFNITDGTIENCSYTYTPTKLTGGTEVTITVTANTGYEFTTAPTADATDFIEQEYITATGIISDDKLTATITLTSTQTTTIANQTDESDRTFKVNASATVKTSVSYPFITLYRPTEDELKQLRTKRYRNATSGTLEGAYTIDLADYITSLKRFYCDVPATNKQSVTLGLYDTEIDMLVVDDDTMSIDCGTVTLASTNDNNNDYINTRCKIFLPFIGSNSIDASIVMNKTLSLTYKVSLITGACVASLTSDDITLYTFNGNIAEAMPYTLSDDYNLIGNISDINAMVLQGFTPSITVMYHDNYNDNGTVLSNDNKVSVLSELSGLNYVDNIEITSDAITDDEISMILTTLRNGVIF